MTPCSAISLRHHLLKGVVAQRLSIGLFVGGGESLASLAYWYGVMACGGQFFCLSFWFGLVFFLESLNTVYLDSYVFLFACSSESFLHLTVQREQETDGCSFSG